MIPEFLYCVSANSQTADAELAVVKLVADSGAGELRAAVAEHAV